MSEGLEILKKFCSSLPDKPGIYKMFSAEGEPLYIGKAKNLKKRVSYYIKDDLPNRLKRMVFLTRKTEYMVTNSEAEAFLLEALQIKRQKPRFNILLKDDKSFPYIKLTTNHEYPQILKFRGRKSKDYKLFGPFASVGGVERTINVIKKIFKVRTCSDSYFESRTRPCLQYQIGRCSAPCTEKISKEDYSDSIQNTIDFLSGKTHSLQKKLSEKMEYFAENMMFEKAAEIRDNIKALSAIQQRTGVESSDIADIDVVMLQRRAGIVCVCVFFYRSGQNYGSIPYFPKVSEDTDDQEILSGFLGQFYQKRSPAPNILCNIEIDDASAIEQALFDLHKAKTKFISSKTRKYKDILDHTKINAKEFLEKKITENSKSEKIFKEIQERFELPEIPSRIEVYDNSHIMGKYAVGAMVVASKDGFEKNEYRKFTIETNSNEYGGDDYQMMREVLTRRIKRFKTEPERIPSLMIIDGGKGHLSTIEKLFKENSIYIPFVCMSKSEKRNAGFETFHMPLKEPFTIENKEEIMKYIQILRDEVHNFAIKSHRAKRAKSISASALDVIPSVGSKRKKALLNHFGSVDAIKEAKISEIAKVDGISKNIAEQILKFFKSE